MVMILCHGTSTRRLEEYSTSTQYTSAICNIIVKYYVFLQVLINNIYIYFYFYVKYVLCTAYVGIASLKSKVLLTS